MNRVALISLFLCSLVQIVFCSSAELKVEQFEELIQDDPLESAFGKDPQLDEPPTILTSTTEILAVADALLCEHKPVNHRTETQAAHFTSSALAKRNEKEERKATLCAQIAIYETQIARSLSLADSIERDIVHHTRLLDESTKALAKLVLSEEKARKELERFDYVESPTRLREAAQKVLEGFAETKIIKESEEKEHREQKKRLSAALESLKTTLAELIVRRDNAAQELAEVNALIAQLNTKLIKTDIKYMTSSPVLVKEAE